MINWKVCLILPALSAVACDDGGSNNGNDAPLFSSEWEGTPSLGQGTALTLDAFTIEDPQGDLVTAAITSSDPGLSVQLDEELQTITLRADYKVEGEVQVSLELEDEDGAMGTGAFEVDVLPIAWIQGVEWTASSGPQAREHGAVVVDQEGGRVILVTGSGYDPYLDPLTDVWQFDLDQQIWTEIEPEGDPLPGGGSKRVAQIFGQQVAYLFGGYGDGGAGQGDLFRLDFSQGDLVVTAIDQVNSPGPRSLHAFSYDPELDRFVMFGGIGSGIENDTWVMTLDGDVATWETLDTTEPPSPRYGFFYGFDQAEGRLVVYSGAQGTSQVNPATDTWILDSRQTPAEWNLVSEGEEEGVPPGRRNGCMVWDETNRRLFVFGGTPDAQTSAPGLYVFDASEGFEGWTLLELEDEPPIRSSGFGFHVPGDEILAMGFGNTTSAIFADWNYLGY